MGALRIVGIIFITIFLIPFLIIGNVFMAMSMSYSLDSISSNLKPVINDVVSGQISQQVNQQRKQEMPEEVSREDIPENNSSDKIPEQYENNLSEMTAGEMIVKQCSSDQGQDPVNFMIAKVPCSEIGQTPSEAIGNAIEYIYNKDQDCGFIDCYTSMEGGKSIIISKKTDSNLSKISWIFTAIILFFMFLAFLTYKRKTSFMIYSGIILIVFSPIATLLKNIITNQISGALPTGASQGSSYGLIDAVKSIFFGNAEALMLIWIIAGILLTTGGITIKIINKYSNKKEKGNKRERRQRVPRE